jgi:Stigma-specific protein, Stig1
MLPSFISEEVAINRSGRTYLLGARSIHFVFPPWLAGLAYCRGSGITDLNTDPNNCGACANRCLFNPALNRQIEACCDTGACVDSFESNPRHCGNCETDCSVTCGADCVCSSWHCCPPCHVWWDGGRGFQAGCYSCDDLNLGGAHYKCCDGTNCTDLHTDPNHCGDCFENCTAYCPYGLAGDCYSSNRTCEKGVCGCYDPNAPDLCDGQCVNLQTSQYSCGICGRSCPSGFTCCDGDCVFLQDDDSNCGFCGHKCGALNCCNGKCTDTSSDPANCRYCGVVCPPGQICSNWTCITPVPIQ